MKQLQQTINSTGRLGRRKKLAGSTRSKVAKPRTPRTTVRRILVPVDFSPASLQALNYAADRAREWKAAIVLLHIMEPVLAERRLDGRRAHRLNTAARRANRRLHFLARTRISAETPVEARLLSGEPSATILQAAAETDSDLIIMGSVGRKGIRRLLLGSVAEQVIRNANCPVTIVHQPRIGKRKPMRGESGSPHGERGAIVLMGSPGSGKTTLARALNKRMPISIIEVGTLLRREADRETILGKKIKPFTSTGKMVPLAHVIQIVSNALQDAREDLVLFDGIPRSTGQIIPFLEMLAEQGLKLRAVIILKLDLQTALNRLAGRHLCNRCGALHYVPASASKTISVCARCGGRLIQRADDHEEVVRERFERFNHETLPVIEFFKREFSKLTWEQSATTPLKQRVDQVWGRLKRMRARVNL